MTEAVLTLLEAAVKQSDIRHFVLFYGVDDLPERTAARCRDLGIPNAFIRKGPGDDFRSLCQMSHLLARLRPSMAYCHMTQPLPCLLLHRLTHPGFRIVSIEHHSNSLKTTKDWFLTFANHAFANRTIYLTPQYRDEIRQRLGHLFRPLKVAVIPNAIDTGKFRPAHAPSDSPPLLIGMTARMVPGKDFASLLHAFRQVVDRCRSADVRLQLAGDGPLRESLEMLSRELGISQAIDFLGELSQAELIPIMQRWRIFVLSTLGETMSRSIMEAQSIGLPIVSTLVPGVASSIEPGSTGLLVPPQDPEAMAEAILTLLDSPALRAALGRHAREKALREYSAEEAWRRYCELSHSFRSN